MKPSEAVRLVSKLRDGFPHAKIPNPQGTLQVYAEMLQDLEYADAERAVIACMTECKYFPTIAEIRERIAAATVNAQPSALAWNAVLQAIGKFGVYQTPAFEDPLVSLAVSAVGWRSICNSTTPGVERAHFLRAYEAASEQAKRTQNTDKLLAAIDQRRIAGMHETKALPAHGGPQPIAEAIKEITK